MNKPIYKVSLNNEFCFAQPKFKKGDLVLSITTGFTGVVIDVFGMNYPFICTVQIAPSMIYNFEETELQLIGVNQPVQLSNGMMAITLPGGLKAKECIHKWETYTGLFDNYKYCLLCDRKKK